MSRKLQSLDLGALYYFFTLDLSMYGVTEPLRFHCNGSEEVLNVEKNRYDLNDVMMYRGDAYSFVGIDVQGIELSSDGKVNSPDLRIINKLNGQLGAITALCRQYNDLIDAKLTIVMCTAESYENSTLEYIEQVWWIDSKGSDDGMLITFPLTSAVDQKKQQVPTRMIMDICAWALRGEYRGEACGYAGDKYFDAKGNPTATIDQDDCGGLCSDCILRFGYGVALPFGGFLIVNKTDF